MATVLITAVVVALLVILDQVIKLWATAVLAPVGAMPLIPGVVELRYYLNDGAAFSSFSGQQFFLIAFTSVAMVAIAAYLLIKRPARKLEYWAWVLVLAGGIGNWIDRVFNHQVVDYINFLFIRFAIFNLADVLVCTGIGLLILNLILEELAAKKKASGEKTDGTI